MGCPINKTDCGDCNGYHCDHTDNVEEDEVNKLDDMDFKEFNLKLFNLFKAGCAAREKMFAGNRPEAMRIYKLIGEDLRIWGEYLRKLVY